MLLKEFSLNIGFESLVSSHVVGLESKAEMIL
jgi:hypothetical protein